MSKTTELPPVGTRETCARCDRAVWLRRVGTMGYSGHHPNAPVFEWCGRRGSKPSPRHCPVSDGYPMTHHHPAGYELVYYGEPE